MYELETLTVPKELGEWLQSRGVGESLTYFSTIDALYHYWESVISSPTGSFITDNKKEILEVIIGSRGYRIEKEPLYHALVKGHELLTRKYAFKYWSYDTFDDVVFTSELPFQKGRYITEMIEEGWNELGINDSNADFVRVEEI